MTYPLQFFQYRNGSLCSGDVPLAKIAEKFGTPVYVYSAEGFLDPFHEFQNGLRDLNHLICFALKANSNLSVLRLLAKEGAGMDLVSGGELYRAGLAGVAADKIVFSGVGKTAEEMEMALMYRGEGIFSFNVESLAELRLLNEVALKMGRTLKGRRAPVALRFNPDVDAKTHPYISTGLKKNKFGIQRKEVLEVARTLGQFKGIELKGLSIHIGSQLLSLSPLDDAFGRVHNLMDEVNAIIHTPLQFVDLGGGIGITYKNEKAPSIQKYCGLIKKHFGKKSYKILIEPGRTLSGNAGVLLTKVIYRKERQKKDFLVVDAAMNDLLRPALYESYHEMVPVQQKGTQAGKKPSLIKTNIVGPVCESSDCFASDRPFPQHLGSGDLVAILSAGAYGFSMSSTYNSRPRPPEVLVEGEKYRVIRKRETYEDLTRGE